MAALSALVWFLSIGILLVGVVCLVLKRFLIGLLMIGGSFLVWFVSIGMLMSATPTAKSSAAGSPPATPTAVPTAAATAAPPKKIGPDTGKWERLSGQSAMDDSTTVSYTLWAERPIGDWVGRPHKPELYVRCREHKLNAYVVVGMPANPELGEYQRYSVRLRFDSAPAISQHWSESTDNEALFSPTPLDLAHRLAKTDRLLFEFTPFRSPSATVEFDTHGFEPALKEVLAACKQK